MRIVMGLLAVILFLVLTPAVCAADEVTLRGNLVCNGACIESPKEADHVMVLFAIDGTPEVKADLEKIMAEWPEKGLDAAGAEKMLGVFDAKLKYYILPESPALKAEKKGQGHYCQPAAASAVTGMVTVKDGKRWILASKIAPAALKYPGKMLAEDKPLVLPEKDAIVLKITDKLILKCIAVPPGKFLMGSPYYAWPYFQEEYPHEVTLTKTYYMAEIPVTRAMYEAVMGSVPASGDAKSDPLLPYVNPKFAECEKFCEKLSTMTGRKVRLPTDAEWEYAARVGTSNPGFQEKYKEQNSSMGDGTNKVAPVKSKKPNAWGFFDMASCWWEITGDKGMYNVRHAEKDPAYPPARPETERSQRNGRGYVKEGWTIVTHEFITEKGYAGQKFRVVVEAEEK